MGKRTTRKRTTKRRTTKRRRETKRRTTKRRTTKKRRTAKRRVARRRKRTTIRGTKSQVWRGAKEKTKTSGQTKKDLMKNKRGKIVSKKSHAAGLKQYKKNGLSKWTTACMKARSSKPSEHTWVVQSILYLVRYASAGGIHPYGTICACFSCFLLVFKVLSQS